MKKLVIGLVSLAVLAGLAFHFAGGMAWVAASGVLGEQKEIESRLSAYWNARVKDDPQGMAAFVHPEQGTLMQSGLLETVDWQLLELNVEGEEAIAKLQIKSRLRHPLFSSRERQTEMTSRWVRYEGEWYREPSPTTLGGQMRRAIANSPRPTDSGTP